MNPFIMKKSLLALSFGISAFSFGQMTMTSSAMIGDCNCYQLTANAASDKGAIWSPVPINLTNSFDMTFDIYLGNPPDEFWAGDGMVFVLQQNATGIGDYANTLGYKDVAPLNSPAISTQSIGIEIDTYNNAPSVPTDVASDHIGINSNGGNNHNLGGPYAIPEIENGAYHEFRVLWDPTLQVMSVFLDGAFIFAYNNDIITNIFTGNPIVYFGFTAATGGSYNEMRVCMNRNAAFNADITSICSDLPVSFTDNSTSDLNNILDYTWDFGDGSPLDFNQDATHSYSTPGTYTAQLVMTDVSGCTDSAQIDITVLPDLVIDVVGTDITCFGDGDGQAVANPQNGLAPYVYLWDDPLVQATQTATNLGPASYNVTVTDDLGCTGIGSVTIIEPALLVADVLGNDVMCNRDSSATASASGTGGTAPYSFLWDDSNAQTTQDATNLPAGTYNVIVTDANGCTATDFWTVNEPSPIFITGLVTYDNGTTNGAVDATITGGTAPYASTVWSNSATTEDITGLTSGTYTITVTDANGCIKDTTFNIKSSVGLTDPSKPAFVIYPNPTDGQFQIQTTGDYLVIIHDAAGRIVYRKEASDNSNVNIQFVESGVYMVEIIKDNKSYFERIVVQ